MTGTNGSDADYDALVVGSVLELWSTDPQTKIDVQAWAGKVGHEYLGHLSADGYERVFIRRAK